MRVTSSAALALLAVLGVLPWTVGLWVDWQEHDTTRVAAIGLAVFASATLLLPATEVGASVTRAARWLALAAIAAVLLRSALAPAPDPALREVATFLGMVAVAALLGRGATTLWLGRAVVLAGTAYALSMLGILLAVESAALVASDPALKGSRIDFFGYSNFRFFNHVQTVVLPLTLGVAALDPHPRWRWLARLGAAAGLALLFQAWGRATGLALVLATGVVLLSGLRIGGPVAAQARRLLQEAVAAATVGALVVLGLWLLNDGLSTQITGTRTESNLERLDLVRFALARSFDAPLWGIGPMHLAGMRGMNAAHPHNAWMQVVAEWGWPAGLALLGAVVLAARRMWQALRSAPALEAAWGLVLLATGVAVLIDSLFSGNFVMPMSQLWIALLGGWMLAWWRHLPGRAAPPAPWLGRPAILVLVAVQVWLVASIAPEVRRWPQPMDEAFNRYPNEFLNPRFWSHGWFGEPGPRP